MLVFLCILAGLLWLASVWALYGRQLLAPALSYAALVCLSFARVDGIRWLPLNGTILTGWLVMSVIVMVTVILQPETVRLQTRGTTFMLGGGLAGLALGLLAFTTPASITALYAWMVIGTAAGTAAGFLCYASTPEGRPVRPGSGKFLRFLLAKGFPTAITLMQLGVALVLILAMNKVNAL